MEAGEVKSVRDLLAVALAPDLLQFMQYQQVRLDYPKPLTPDQTTQMAQELVGFVLDHVTPYAFQMLATQAAEKAQTMRAQPVRPKKFDS